MFSLSHHSWKPAGLKSGRDKLVKNGHHHDAIRTIHNHNHFSEDEEASESEKVQAPMVRIGVLSRSTNTPAESMEMMPPSRVQSYRVSDSSIESIRQSLREMELQLVVAQNTVAAETRAEYDLYYQSSTLVNPEKLPVMTKEDEEEENYDGKENACPVDQDTDQDIKRVLDDLQWAEFVTFRSPKPTHKRTKSQTGRAAMCIKSMGRNCHPERQGKSWWRKHPVDAKSGQ